MTIDDIKRKNLILRNYINSLFDDYKVKAEYSTNDDNQRVIVIQEQSGEKVVFYGECAPLFDYYMVWPMYYRRRTILRRFRTDGIFEKI